MGNENKAEHSPKPHTDRPGNGHGEDKPHQDVVRARVTQDQLRFYGVGMSLPQWVGLFDDYRGLYLVIKMIQWNSPPSLLTVATIHVLQVYCGGYSQVALDAAEPISVTSHCCHDTRSLLRRLLELAFGRRRVFQISRSLRLVSKTSHSVRRLLTVTLISRLLRWLPRCGKWLR